MITLYVDADACPVTRDAISVARAHRVPVVLVGNESQNLASYASRPGVQVIQVGTGRDAADFAIVERLSPGDVVVTGDTGLAAMALGRGSQAVSPRGRVFSMVTIDAELAVRHAEQRLRRAGGRTRGPAPFEDEDRGHFRESLGRLLEGDRAWEPRPSA
ncbi:MAG: YaiI/YqxD family protein [Thermoleophilia bacterium]|nr:YaiI/YqxD family protein [Thermoleophilia bacterium]